MVDIDITHITGVFCNSKAVIPGSIFIAIKGPNVDGHDFIKEAISAGAGLIIGSKLLDLPNYLQVDNPRAVYNELVLRHFGLDLTVDFSFIGITGTNGKTTISFFIEQLLASLAIKSAVIGTVNYRVGGKPYSSGQTCPSMDVIAPLLKEAIARDVRCVIMEVSSHALHQDRVAGISFDVAVFTNLTQDHLDYHKSMEEYYRAKRRLFLEYVKKDGVAVLDKSAPYADILLTDIRQSRPDLRLFVVGEDGLEIKGRVIIINGNEIVVPENLIGAYNVVNVALAVLSVVAMGFSVEDVAQCAGSLMPAPGRMELHKRGGVSVIIDYAHSPDALEKALNAIRQQGDYKRIICVFGCGGDRDKGKRPKMGKIAETLSDAIVLTSDNPRSEDEEAIIHDILSGIANHDGVIVEPNRGKAICRAIEMAQTGDVVLVAGKGHEDYQEIGGRRYHFSDKEEVEGCLNRLKR